MYCQVCGADAPTKHVTFMQNIGLLVLRLGSTTSGSLCRRCIDRTFWTKTLITLFAGWWGVISFFFTPIILITNVVNYLGALSLPRVPQNFSGAVAGAPGIGGPAIGGLGPSSGFVSGAQSGAAQMQAARGSGGKGILIFGGILGGLVLICCVLTGALAAGGTFLQGRVAASGIACEGRPVQGAPAFVPSASPGIVAMQRSDGRWQPDFGVVPTSFHTADTTEEAALVLCMEPQEDENVETCDYTTGARITRVRHRRRVRVVVASTGATLRDDTVTGREPTTCPNEIEGTSSTTYEGDDVEGDALVPTINAALGLGPPPTSVGGK